MNASGVRFMGFSLIFCGKGALLTAQEYFSAVRSHQAVRTAGFPLPSLRERKAGPIARVAMVSTIPKRLKRKAMHRSS